MKSHFRVSLAIGTVLIGLGLLVGTVWTAEYAPNADEKPVPGKDRDQPPRSGNPLSELKSRLGDRGQRASEIDPNLRVGEARGPSSLEEGKHYTFEIDITNSSATREARGWIRAAIPVGEGTINGENPRRVIVPVGEKVTISWAFDVKRLENGRFRYGAELVGSEKILLEGSPRSVVAWLDACALDLTRLEADVQAYCRDLHGVQEHRRFLTAKVELWEARWKLEAAIRANRETSERESLRQATDRIEQSMRRSFEEQAGNLRDMRLLALTAIPKLEETLASAGQTLKGRITIPEETRNAQLLRLNSLQHRLRDARDTIASHIDPATHPLPTDVRGQSVLFRPNRPQEVLSQAQPLLHVGPGDSIETGPRSFTGVRFPDGAKVQLGSEARVRLGDSTATLEVERGWGRLKVEQLPIAAFKERVLKFYHGRSPDRPWRNPFTVSVRGSDVLYFVNQDSIRILVREGEAEITLKDAKKVIVKAGQEITWRSEPRSEDVKQIEPERCDHVLSKEIGAW